MRRRLGGVLTAVVAVFTASSAAMIAMAWAKGVSPETFWNWNISVPFVGTHVHFVPVFLIAWICCYVAWFVNQLWK